MPLRDHFHPPLAPRRHWHAFHNSWATYLSSDLNRQLPEGYYAEANVQFNIEIDVASFEDQGSSVNPLNPGTWTPDAPGVSVPIATIADIVEVEVFSTEGGMTLAGAIELVSPSNKDRPESRDAFVTKCASYLHQGIGLIVVDLVTSRAANLHNEMMDRLQAPDEGKLDAQLYAVAYHPVKRNDGTNADLWREKLVLGRKLPTLPLWLRGGLVLPVDLEAAYERTCLEQRVSPTGT